jgi:raffinose/stachyose/melibiose transport system substrate-binding protein
MKKILVVLVMWCVAVALFATGGKEGTTGGGDRYKGRELSLLIGSVTLGDAYKTLFDQFQKDTGIKMDLQVVPGSSAEYVQIVQAKIATKDYPDVLIYTSGPSYLNPMNPPENIVEVTNKQWLSKIKEGLTDLGGSYKGKVYGIPFGGIDFAGLLINEKVFEDLSLSPPKTFSQLVSVCEKIKASNKGITPIYEMGKQGGPLSAFIYTDVALKYSQDLGVMNKLNTGQIAFEDTFILDSLKRKMELQDKGFFNDDMMSGTWETLFKALSANKAAMSFVYSNVLPVWYKSYPDVKVKLVPLNDVVASTFIQAIYIMKTKDQDLASEFVSYFLRDTTLTRLYNDLRAVPPYKGIKAEVDPALGAMVKQLNAGKSAPILFDQLVVGIGQVPLLQDMHLKKKTPEEVCKDLTKKMSTLGKEMGLPGF